MSEFLNLPFFDEAHRALAGRLRRFVEDEIEPRASAADAGDSNVAGREFLRLFAESGLLAWVVPEAYRKGMSSARDRTELGPSAAPRAAADPRQIFPAPDLRSICLIREALASASALADTMFGVQGLASIPIARGGSDEMKRRYLPRLATGRASGAFALTEPTAGSDVAGIQTLARREGSHYVVDGIKTLISGAGIADFYVVFARLADADPAPAKPRVSAFVIDAETAGVRVTRAIPLLAPHPIGEMVFEACRVPSASRLGAEGDGMKLALGTLEAFRPTVGAAACGMAARAIAEAICYARERRQFGSAVADFQATRLALADMGAELDAARLLVYRAAWLFDAGEARIPREASMAKLVATEAAQRIVDRAVQIHGGMGVTKGCVVERLYREVRAPRIYEGTSEIQRLIVAEQLLLGGR